MSKDIKIYLVSVLGERPFEVRRFTLPDKGSYTDLCNKIESLSSNLRGTTYSLYWQDNSEYIVFSSDEEFQVACNAMQDLRIINLYALLDKPMATGDNPKNSQGSFHLGVTCDGCNLSPISGYRYKCVYCVDYDLCANCEMRGIHNEHAMIRFNKPLPSSSLLRNPHNLLKRRFNRLLQSSYGNQEDNCCQELSSDSDEVIEIPIECSFKKPRHPKEKHNHKNHRHGDHKGRDEKRRRCFEDIHNLMSGTRCPAARSAATSAGNAFAGLAGHLASYLIDPLGVSGGVNEQQSSGPAPAASASATSNVNTASAAAASANATANVGPTETAAPTATCNDQSSQPSQPREQHSESLANLIQTAMPSLAVAIQEITQNLAQQHVDSGSEDWALINVDDKEESPQPSTSATDAPHSSNGKPAQPENGSKLYPDLTPLTPRHPNANIQRGIDTLISMGYSNNSQLLTTLLEVYNGDIHKALDVLQDHQK